MWITDKVFINIAYYMLCWTLSQPIGSICSGQWEPFNPIMPVIQRTYNWRDLEQQIFHWKWISQRNAMISRELFLLFLELWGGCPGFPDLGFISLSQLSLYRYCTIPPPATRGLGYNYSHQDNSIFRYGRFQNEKSPPTPPPRDCKNPDWTGISR